jgi:catechol 2,3-dioxygenase-like lactoylglutathione lyase family enzyme
MKRIAAVTLLVIIALSSSLDAAGIVQGIGTIGLTVSDVDRSVAFYRDVLGFETQSDVLVSGAAFERSTGLPGARARVVRMRLGDESIELTQYLSASGRPIPADSRSNDRWFQHVAIIVSDMDRAYAHLVANGVEHTSPAPQRIPDGNVAAAGIRAFYFKDPDGHPLEILSFPPDRGDARWHRPTTRLFLGIDHTAIVVADTARSLSCYRDVLGLGVGGESVNHGPEQERLNNVPGARLRITMLRAAAGPGIELLEYLAPRDGRPIPHDARPDDLSHWQVALVVGDTGALNRALPGSACSTLSDGAGGAFLLRDPDGHALQAVEGK